MAGGPAAPPERGAAPVTADGAPIRGSVRVAPDLDGVASAAGGAVVFVIARRAGAAGGPPLAVKRLPAAGFPVPFTIGPGDVMVPSFRFDGPIRLEARLDRDGNATSRTAGDLAGEAPGTYEPGASDVAIVLDRRL